MYQSHTITEYGPSKVFARHLDFRRIDFNTGNSGRQSV